MIQKPFTLLFALLLSGTFSFSQKKTAIPFTVAHNYFVKNTFKKSDFTSNTITSRAVFDTIFGMAATMGENGKPTAIDFTKQFVIVVINGETSTETQLVAESLTLVGKKKMLFEFNSILGKDQGYTSVPFLLIVVDKKYKGYSLDLQTHSVL